MSAQVDANASPDAGSNSELAKTDDKQPDAGELQRQLEHANTLLKEERNAKEFWYEKANSKPAPTQAAVQQQAPQAEEDFGSLVDIVTENRVGDLEKMIRRQVEASAADLLKKGNYVSADEVDRRVAAKVSEVQAAQSLVSEFPELVQEGSPLALEAGRQLELLERNPAYKNVPEIEKARIAAIAAENHLLRSGQGGRQSGRQPTREERIAAQQPGGGSYGRQPGEESSELTESQRAWAEKFGITPEQYKQGQKITHIVGMGRRS